MVAVFCVCHWVCDLNWKWKVYSCRLFPTVYNRDQGNGVLYNYVKPGCVINLKQKTRLKTYKRPGDATSVSHKWYNSTPASSGLPPPPPHPFPHFKSNHWGGGEGGVWERFGLDPSRCDVAKLRLLLKQIQSTPKSEHRFLFIIFLNALCKTKASHSCNTVIRDVTSF